MKEIQINEVNENVFTAIGKEWMLITAGGPEKFNTMTASWGGFGYLWDKNVAFIFVRPERYTFEFLEARERVTLAFLGNDNRRVHSICGSKSGRDTDKVATAGLQPISTPEGEVTFEQARLTIVGKKLYSGLMRHEDFVDKDALSKWYHDGKNGSMHQLYVVEIERILIKES